jgi:ribosome biogenesis GTPase
MLFKGSLPMDIKKLGFDKWFSDRIDSAKLTEYEIARVIAVNKDSFLIRNKHP